MVQPVAICGTSNDESDDSLPGRLREAAQGFLQYGPNFWPGAHHFVLLELDDEGSCTGDAALVCRACVREAAAVVEARVLSQARQRLLDLVGDSSPQDGPCCICGSCPDT
jgi:hypothetical protein